MVLCGLPYSKTFSSFPRSNNHPKFGIHYPYIYFYTYYCIHECTYKQYTALFLNYKKQHCYVSFCNFFTQRSFWHMVTLSHIVLVHLFFSLLYNKHCTTAQIYLSSLAD